ASPRVWDRRGCGCGGSVAARTTSRSCLGSSPRSSRRAATSTTRSWPWRGSSSSCGRRWSASWTASPAGVSFAAGFSCASSWNRRGRPSSRSSSPRPPGTCPRSSPFAVRSWSGGRPARRCEACACAPRPPPVASSSSASSACPPSRRTGSPRWWPRWRPSSAMAAWEAPSPRTLTSTRPSPWSASTRPRRSRRIPPRPRAIAAWRCGSFGRPCPPRSAWRRAFPRRSLRAASPAGWSRSPGRGAWTRAGTSSRCAATATTWSSPTAPSIAWPTISCWTGGSSSAATTEAMAEVRRQRETYVELRARSAFSFLRGASQPEDLALRAADLGYEAVALGDHGGLYGMPRFSAAARQAGLRPIVAADVDVEGIGSLRLLVEDEKGYKNLCRLLTLAHARGPKGTHLAYLDEVAEHAQGLFVLLGACRDAEAADAAVRRLGRERVAAEVCRYLDPAQERWN